MRFFSIGMDVQMMLERDRFDVLAALGEASFHETAKAKSADDKPAGFPAAGSASAAAPASTVAATSFATLDALEDEGFITRGSSGTPAITDDGLQALEPYRAKRAVLFAAGFGSRMVPITLTTPKPLVTVKGRRIIDTLLDALIAVGIEDITVVRGYLAPQFDQLLDRYPTIRFVDNPLYDTTNNISSAVAAKDRFECAYAFESDLLLANPGLITRYQYCSNYLGVPVAHTDDWCFHVEDGIIRNLTKGGDDCHHMFGISYWSAADGVKLASDLPKVFARDDSRDIFWDDVPIVRCPDHYSVHIRPCTFDDVTEIDTFEELQALDPTYR